MALLGYIGAGLPASAQQVGAAAAQNLRSADTAFHAGYDAVQRGDLAAAEQDFAKVARLTPGVAAGHAAYGSVLLSLGKLDAAIRELERARQIDPHEASAPMNLAMAYVRAGKNDKALPLFEDALSTSGAMALSPDAWFAYAQALLASGNLAKAQKRMNEAVAAYPQNAILTDTLGVVLAKEQDYAAAEQRFREAVALQPDLAQAHLHLGTTLLLERRPEDAVAELKIAAAAMPSSADAQYELGRALTAERQDDLAVEVLKKAMTLDPDAAALLDVKYALAVALQNRGRDDEALPLFKEVAAARPDDGAVLTNLGLALVQTGKAKEALPFYERALRLNAHDWILQQDMGVAYLQQSDLDHAIEHFEAGLAIDPGNAQLHYDLGLAYKLKDKLPEAIAALTKAEEEDASLEDAPYTLGVLLMQTGKFAEARSELQKATRLRPDNGDAWSVLGSVDKSLNAPESAADLKTAIQLQPTQPGNHITLAAVYAQQGRHDEAVAERKIAADLSRTAVNKQKAHFALDSGKALLQQGHVDDAIAQLRAAIAADDGNAEAHLALADALTQQGRGADAAIERQKGVALQNH